MSAAPEAARRHHLQEMSMPTRTHLVTDSPIGPLTLVHEDGVLAGLYMDGHRPAPRPDTLGIRVDAGFESELEQLGAYFAGQRMDFGLALAPAGTPFQRRAWSALRAIPYGATRSYSEIAAAIGAPSAVRAVASANARNPLSIVVPCHRVVGRDGSLTGYAGGLGRKRFLLDLERSVADRRRAA
jgi:methylated-DNA-[protein]-cysteine S-methyltransferase